MLKRPAVLDASRTASANSAAFERFWQPYRPRIWRLVARLAGSVDLADDLTQEVGLRAFQAFGMFRGGSAGFTWLYRIAVNVVLRHREQQRAPSLPLDHADAADLPAASHMEPEAAALRGELRERVWAALDRLPEETRVTLILHSPSLRAAQIHRDRRCLERPVRNGQVAPARWDEPPARGAER